MIERLEIIKERYESLNQELLNPDILKDIKKTRELSKKLKKKRLLKKRQLRILKNPLKE